MSWIGSRSKSCSVAGVLLADHVHVALQHGHGSLLVPRRGRHLDRDVANAVLAELESQLLGRLADVRPYLFLVLRGPWHRRDSGEKPPYFSGFQRLDSGRRGLAHHRLRSHPGFAGKPGFYTGPRGVSLTGAPRPIRMRHRHVLAEQQRGEQRETEDRHRLRQFGAPATRSRLPDRLRPRPRDRRCRLDASATAATAAPWRLPQRARPRRAGTPSASRAASSADPVPVPSSNRRFRPSIS